MRLGFVSDWHILGSAARCPLTAVQRVSGGGLESDPLAYPATSPVRFWVVEPGDPGHVVTFASGVLIHEALMPILSGAVGSTVSVLAAVLERRSAPIDSQYFLVRPQLGMCIEALHHPYPEPLAIAYVVECPATVVVTSGLRQRLETSTIRGLSFDEPVFVV